MFDAIAGRYDFLNHFLSAGIDRRWRRQAVRSLGLTGSERVLDLCTGTGDLAIALLPTDRPGAAGVVGVDFAAAMLAVGRDKLRRRGLADRIHLARADATRVPLPAGSIDAITIGFGIRNVDDTAGACREMHRVLVPGGRLAILEFAVPPSRLFRAVYMWYFRHVLPRLGRLISRHDMAYEYLPASVGAFASPSDFAAVLRHAGFVDVSARPLTFGSVVLYNARKP
jgi:demethylmenaquinone methyltransferase/2-methoxy-6-polyprenyl-1,4-benzoquinol methylase